MKKLLYLLIIFIFIFFLLNQIFAYFYEKPIRQAIRDKTHEKFLRWNDIHNFKNEYNTIFLGSSRGYCAYNPLIFDSIAGTSSYNMCTGSQNIIESYYILEEILKFQKPETVIYEIFLASFDENTDYYHVLSNGSFMTKQVESEMIIKGFGIEGVVNYLFPVLKHRAYIKNDISDILLHRKLRDRTDSNKIKWIKGYRSDSSIVDAAAIKAYQPLYSFKDRDVSDKKLNYHFQAFIELCRKNNIKLICVTAPFPPTRLKLTTIDTVYHYFKSVCEKQNIPYFDFNHLENSNYEYSDTDFFDEHHMNVYGAKKVTKQLAEIILQENTEITKF